MALADPISEPDELSPEQATAVRAHLKEVIASQEFAGSKRAQDFLQLIVEHALAGRLDNLRERMIGAEMFGRPIDYDTANDAVVRVKATEVRKKLTQYYLSVAKPPALRIEVPAGSYVPRFCWEAAEEPTGGAAAEEASEIPALEVMSTDAAGEAAGEGRSSQAAAAEAARGLGGRWMAIAAAAVLLGVVGYFSFKTSSNRLPPNRGVHSVAILPLANLSRDPQQEYFADGLTDELITDLGQVSALRVISRTSVMTYKGSNKRLPVIARELRVDAVVEGSVLREGDQVRITAQLIDARTDQHMWAHSYVRDLKNVLALQGEVAQAIADQVSIKVTPQEHARLRRARPMNTDAQDLYLKGVHLLDAGQPRVAAEYLQKSVDKDPSFAPAHTELASAYGSLGEAGGLTYDEAFVREKAEASEAIQLDDALPAGHADLANAEINENWAWNTAEGELKRAIGLNPNFAPAHGAYAQYLLRVGRTPEGLAEIQRELELDPVSGRSSTSAGLGYYYARRYSEALAHMQRASQIQSNAADFLFPLGVIYTEKGDYAEAVHNFQQLGDQPHALGHLGNLYGRMGRSAEARAILPKLERRVAKDGLGRYEIALIYIGLGDKERAFAWLERSVAAHDQGVTYLKIDPCLDPVRSDARLGELMQRVGLPL